MGLQKVVYLVATLLRTMLLQGRTVVSNCSHNIVVVEDDTLVVFHFSVGCM